PRRAPPTRRCSTRPHASRGAARPAGAGDPHSLGAPNPRRRRGLAAPEAARRPLARGRARGRERGRADDRRIRAGGLVRADASRATRRARARDDGRARYRLRRGDRPRRDRSRAARASLPRDRRRPSGFRDPRTRSGDDPRRCPPPRQRGRGVDPPRATRDRRRDRPYRAVKLCLFTPLERPVRGWVGAIEGDRVVHLAAQTLASFFTGGGSAREHDEYALEDVRLLAPVPRPPSVRDAYAFEEHIRNAARVTGRPGVPDEWYELPVFYFSNPAAIYGPDDGDLYPAG